MLNCQHVKPIYEAKVSQYYTHLSPQPLKVYFDFVPKHKHRSSIGKVKVSITVATRQYGPYLTTITATTNVWWGRKSLRPSKQSLEIAAQVRGLNALLEEAWHSLLSLKEPITGDMILAKAGLLEKGVSNA